MMQRVDCYNRLQCLLCRRGRRRFRGLGLLAALRLLAAGLLAARLLLAAARRLALLALRLLALGRRTVRSGARSRLLRLLAAALALLLAQRLATLAHLESALGHSHQGTSVHSTLDGLAEGSGIELAAVFSDVLGNRLTRGTIARFEGGDGTNNELNIFGSCGGGALGRTGLLGSGGGLGRGRSGGRHHKLCKLNDTGGSMT